MNENKYLSILKQQKNLSLFILMLLYTLPLFKY